MKKVFETVVNGAKNFGKGAFNVVKGAGKKGIIGACVAGVLGLGVYMLCKDDEPEIQASENVSEQPTEATNADAQVETNIEVTTEE